MNGALPQTSCDAYKTSWDNPQVVASNKHSQPRAKGQEANGKRKRQGKLAKLL